MLRQLWEELRRRWWLVLGLVVLLIVLFGARLATFYTDILWFSDVGFAPVFWTLLTTQLGLGVVAALVVMALLAGNLLLARRMAPNYRIPSQQEETVERYRRALEPFARGALLAVAVVVGILSGLSIAPQWPTYVLWANAQEFGSVDPQFGRDLGFFVFDLPFLTLINSWLFTALALTIILTVLAHYVFGGIRPQSPGQKLTPQANVHLSILLAFLVGVRAWGFWLDRYMLSYSSRGQVTGLSYTDVNAELVALQLLTFIAAACVVLFIINIWVRGFLFPTAGVAILVVAALVLSGIIPAVVQRLQVDPEELAREEQYIARNLELTRFGFGLEDVAMEPFAAESQLTPQAVEDNSATLESIRMWDPTTLQQTYRQLQELRPYYDFHDVDVDRYDFAEEGGRTQQVMISVRELSTQDLAETAQTWQNQRLEFTHGFGLVASSVSLRRENGQPVFFAQDIPPQGVEELEIGNPRLYYGEGLPSYSLVGTSVEELDYARPGEDPRRFRYDGEGGVGIGNIARRLAFSMRFAEPNIVLSNLIDSDSKVIFNRQVRERVSLVAPYLKLDNDPYPVAVDDRIKWIIDGYTTTDMLPYSERVDLGALSSSVRRELVPVATANGQVELRERVIETQGLPGTANYIRNSVKAVVDAYDGTVELYVADSEDPVLQAWRSAFPESFTPFEEASEELRAHFRYPEDMFRVQSSVFSTYHIPDAQAFYNQEDAWEVPTDASFVANQADVPTEDRIPRELRPYYLQMRLPGEDEEEFALIQPFTPTDRDNLIAWLAGRSDPENYGQLKAYVMPPNETVFGPEQIQARINQDDAVSQQVTLWNESNSNVIYGNLLVIPVEDSLLYAQPLFLQAEGGEIPELRRTVLVFGDQLVMEPTLEDALVALFGGAAPEVEPPPSVDAPDDPAEQLPGDDEDPGLGEAVDPRVAQFIEEAVQAFAVANAALTEGDIAGYAENTARAEQALRSAEALLNGEPLPDAPPAPAPTAPPAAESDAEATPAPEFTPAG